MVSRFRDVGCSGRVEGQDKYKTNTRQIQDKYKTNTRQIQEGQDKCIFFFAIEERGIKDTLTCKSENLIYLIECKKCASRNLPCQYIGELKRHLHERFGEHRRSLPKSSTAS